VNRKIITAVFWLMAFAGALPAQLHLPGTGAGESTTKTKKAATPADNTAPAGPIPAAFDYYVLSLSWAPGFCSDPANAAANPNECAPGKHTGFIVHGLWPESNQGKNPESCGTAKPVAKSVLNMMLPYMLSATLVQHEWATHGTCSGLSQADYFTEVVQARVAVQLPVQITGIDQATSESPAQIEQQFAGANPAFPANAFRTACKGADFTEVRVCFDRNIKGVECTPSTGDCGNATEQILPPQ
jgi:ribonuclease T2